MIARLILLLTASQILPACAQESADSAFEFDDPVVIEVKDCQQLGERYRYKVFSGRIPFDSASRVKFEHELNEAGEKGWALVRAMPYPPVMREGKEFRRMSFVFQNKRTYCIDK